MSPVEGYIYGLRCICHPERGIRYVGKTTRSLAYRISGHRYEAITLRTRNAKSNWIRKHGGQNIKIMTLERVRRGADVDRQEKRWIAIARAAGNADLNQLDGGEGMPGWVPSEQTRSIWSSQRKGRAPNLAQISSVSTLTEDQAAQVIARADERSTDLAREFGVDVKTISNIKTGRTWKHLDRSAMPDRWARGGRTHCAAGHDLSIVGTREKGRCAECHRIWARNHYAQKVQRERQAA